MWVLAVCSREILMAFMNRGRWGKRDSNNWVWGLFREVTVQGHKGRGGGRVCNPYRCRYVYVHVHVHVHDDVYVHLHVYVYVHMHVYDYVYEPYDRPMSGL
jgi:hypothetical protein